MPLLFLIFLIVPIVEIALFLQVGDLIGLWPTLGLILATALIGSAVVRIQGMRTLDKARTALARDEVPLREAATGVALLIAGFLLITPGFFTDTLGFLLLIPPLRASLGAWVAGSLLLKADLRMRGGGFPGGNPRGPAGPAGPQQPGRPGDIIDGDYEDLTPGSEPPPAARPNDPGAPDDSRKPLPSPESSSGDPRP